MKTTILKKWIGNKVSGKWIGKKVLGKMKIIYLLSFIYKFYIYDKVKIKHKMDIT